MSETSKFMTLEDGLKLHYREEGNPDGQAVLLVHGFAASVHTWEPLVEDLKSDYRLISLDLPGHGLSRAPYDATTTGMPVFEAALTEFVDRLSLENFVLVGSSMGGDLSWRYALDNPLKLDGLVLVGAAGWAMTEEEAEDQSFVFQLLGNPIARRLLRDIDTSGLMRSGLESSFFNADFVTDEMVDRYISLSRAPGHRAGLMAILSEERSPATFTALARMRVPTLILHGEFDNLVPVSSGKKFADAIPNAQLVIYEETGHLPHEERTDMFAEHMRTFITDLGVARDREVSASLAAGLQP
ncbi:MAG: alpha/beta hydrolase [Pseudomonadota bacterium]